MVNDMLRQDLQFFDRPENTTGALTSRADSYPQAVFELMGFTVAMIVIAFVSVIGCSILAIVFAWKLGLVVVFAGLPPLLFSGYLRIRLEGAMDHKIGKNFSSSTSIASEAINAIRTVSSLAIEKMVLARYTQELDHAIASSNGPLLMIMLPFAFTQSVEYCFLALGFWSVQYLFWSCPVLNGLQVRMPLGILRRVEYGEFLHCFPGCFLFRSAGFSHVWFLEQYVRPYILEMRHAKQDPRYDQSHQCRQLHLLARATAAYDQGN